MIRHVVMFSWNERVDDAHIAATKHALSQLPAEIEQIQHYTYGDDIRVNQANYDFAVSAQFDSVDDYLAYRDHPAHVAFVQTFVVPFCTARHAVQFVEP